MKNLWLNLFPIEEVMETKKKCKSIKSKKHPDLKCPFAAVKGDWCSVHQTSQIAWNPPKEIPIQKQKESSALKIKRFVCSTLLPRIHKTLGPAALFPHLADNEKDIYSYDSIHTIPLLYRFSYIDSKKHIWLFDIRFLIQLLQYGNTLHNPFTQEQIPSIDIDRLQKRSASLVSKKIPVVYIEEDTLTQEQLWNQKVLDVFLKLTALGYGVNVHWFEMMNVRAHELFYESLYELWNFRLNLTEETKQNVIPAYNSGRFPLFRWSPSESEEQNFDIKLWRKMNLNLMKTFISRSSSKEFQSLGALYVLTALAEMHPRVRSAFPWLADV
jgi:hypothetical protein